MNAIIFSKDRPMQLHCLLESLYENMDIFSRVTVIYKTRFYESYELMKYDFAAVDWVEQTILKDDFLRAIGTSMNCLLVDDDIIFREVDIMEISTAAEECDIVSIRLGENIKARKHFDVKSSLDGNFYRGKHLRKMEDEWFTNPNQLEVKLIKHVRDLTMCWMNRSRLIGIPNNKVSATSTCEDMGGDVEELNDMYLRGYRIDYKKMDLEHWNVHKKEQLCLSLGQR